jgi:hypothetical protein
MLVELYKGNDLTEIEIIKFPENILPKLQQKLIASKEDRIDHCTNSINSLIKHSIQACANTNTHCKGHTNQTHNQSLSKQRCCPALCAL